MECDIVMYVCMHALTYLGCEAVLGDESEPIGVLGVKCAGQHQQRDRGGHRRERNQEAGP